MMTGRKREMRKKTGRDEDYFDFLADVMLFILILPRALGNAHVYVGDSLI